MSAEVAELWYLKLGCFAGRCLSGVVGTHRFSEYWRYCELGREAYFNLGCKPAREVVYTWPGSRYTLLGSRLRGYTCSQRRYTWPGSRLGGTQGREVVCGEALG